MIELIPVSDEEANRSFEELGLTAISDEAAGHATVTVEKQKKSLETQIVQLEKQRVDNISVINQFSKTIATRLLDNNSEIIQSLKMENGRINKKIKELRRKQAKN